jgi:Helix-turn-helix domain
MGKVISLTGDDPLFTRQELAERWRQSTETIKRRERAGRLHALKLGRSVRYRLSDVLAFEKAAEIECPN